MYFKTIIPLNNDSATLKTTPKTAPKTTPKKINNNDKLSDNQKEIISLLRNNNFIDQNDIAKILNITVDGVKYNMRELRNKGNHLLIFIIKKCQHCRHNLVG